MAFDESIIPPNPLTSDSSKYSSDKGNVSMPIVLGKC